MGTATQDELMKGVADAVVHVLLHQARLPQQEAQSVASALVERLTFAWGNSTIQIPKGQRYINLQRYRRIFDEFTGDNHSQLAKKFECSIQWIYAVVKRMRQDYINRHQADMFNELPDDELALSDFMRTRLLVLADIMDYSAALISEQTGMDEDRAHWLGEQIANHVSSHLHGQSAYVRSRHNAEKTDDRQPGLFDDDG
ncbi:Mor transcription activator family protein [Serratia marcescens]|uniref:Mor transcription activator family protein n=1 Tax=Serratia marcescens TaxID=615 RepID=UPI0037D6F803